MEIVARVMITCGALYKTLPKMNWQAGLSREGVRATLVLAIILNAIFFPAHLGRQDAVRQCLDRPQRDADGCLPPGSACRRILVRYARSRRSSLDNGTMAQDHLRPIFE